MTGCRWRQQLTTKKKTLDNYILWCSLHRRRPQSGRFAAFIAVVGDDFFLVDVRRNRRMEMRRII